jgi:hypothetical protein
MRCGNLAQAVQPIATRVHGAMQHRFQLSTAVGAYEFSYDLSSRSLCLVRWPDGRSAMRILAAGLPKTIEDATIAAAIHIRYIETDYPSC